MAEWSAEDLAQFYAFSEQLRAELRASVAPAGAALVKQIQATADAERAYAADPDRDDLASLAKSARADLETARSNFDKAVSAAKSTRTRRLSEEMTSVSKAK